MNKKLGFGLAAVISIMSTASFGIENMKITKIEVKNLRELTKEYVLSSIPVKVGDQYANKELSDIYLALRNTGVFSNVNIYPTINGSEVSLLLEVDEVNNAKEELANRQAIINASKRTDLIVNSVKVVGNTEVDLKEILDASSVKVGEYFTPITVNVLANAILSTGYFESVKPSVDRNGNTKTVNVKFEVKENPKLKSITIDGVTAFTVEQIKEVAGLIEGKVINANALNPNTSPILELYQKYGIVTARIIDVKYNDGNIQMKISEGKINKVTFGKTVQKQDGRRFSERQYTLKTKPYVLERMTTLKEGEILTNQSITETIQEFYKTGLFSSVEPKIEGVANDPNGRNVTLILEERPSTSINGQVAYETKEGFTGGITLSDKNFLGNQQEISLQTNFGTRGNYDLSFSFFDPWIKGTPRLQVGTNVFFKREKARKADLEKDGELPSILENVTRISGSYVYGASVTLGKGVARNTFLSVKPRIYGVRSTNAEEQQKVLVDYTLGSVATTVIYDSRNDSYLPRSGFYLSATYELGYIFRDKSVKPSYLTRKKEELKNLYEGKNDTKKTQSMNVAGSSVNNKNGNNDAEALKKAKEEYDKKIKENKNSKDLEEAKKKYEEEVEKFKEKNNGKITLGDTSNQTLNHRFFNRFNVDFRAYHRVYKDKNSMAYRITLGYANEGTPENLMFRVNDGTTLRGYNDEATNAIFTATAENRTYINNYIQLVAFGELGLNSKPTGTNSTTGLQQYTAFKDIFKKENLKIDLGLGARITTPIGVIRLDYAWPLINANGNSKGKFSFGFGQTF
ncbi:BamA/OMP85 family outer membrane protein [Caviibacter abscessus]|uniref:BamA/OMP85 family outer membrane protein n=1 Tax=Caviibacter abscessus TaxID=1766719 RepID=UPI00083995EA|nr:POTRA domain-containing protein [Caviibacter abscessus]